MKYKRCLIPLHPHHSHNSTTPIPPHLFQNTTTMPNIRMLVPNHLFQNSYSNLWFNMSFCSIRQIGHSINHPTYNAHVLARLLLWSITDDFSITIINRISPVYCTNGPLILWTICNNINPNNIACIETIKSKIRTTIISQFGNDVCKNIIHIRDNLYLITITDDSSSKHNDLIVHLLMQLCSSPITPFKEAMQQLHVDYLEAKLIHLTPLNYSKLLMTMLKSSEQTNQ